MNRFVIKHSTVPGKMPTSSDLLFGEIAINIADGRMYAKRANGVIEPLAQSVDLKSFGTVGADTGSLSATGPSQAFSVKGGSGIKVTALSGTRELVVALNNADAATLGGRPSSYFSPASHLHDDRYLKLQALGGDYYTKAQVDANINSAIDAVLGGASSAFDTLKELEDALNSSDTAIGAINATLATKLNASSYTAADVLAKLKTVDGASSGLDADLLDGQQASYYRSATNLNAGTVPVARMSGIYNIGISGNAATASKLAAPYSLSLAGHASGTVDIDGSANATLTVTVANDSHSHDVRYYEKSLADARYMRLAGNQTITGVKTYSGSIEINGASSTPDLIIRRTNETSNANIKFETTSANDTYVGQGDSGHFSVGPSADLRYATNGVFAINATNGDFKWKGVATGNGSGITNLNASNLSAGTISAARLPAATTSVPGAVQLNTAVTSTSTVQAATASAVKAANDNADSRVARTGDEMTGMLTVPSLKVTPGTGIGLGTATPSTAYNINMNDSFAPNGTRAAIYSIANITDGTLTSNRTHYGIYNSLRNDYLSTESFTLTQRAAYNEVVNGPANDVEATINTAEGSRNYVLNRAAGTVSAGYGSYNMVQTSRPGSVIANAYGSYNYIYASGGEIGNAYAGYFRVLGNVTGNSFGIYATGESKNYFSGDVGIGTSTPATKLHVLGEVTATGFVGSGAKLTGLNATQILSGTIGSERLPAASITAVGAVQLNNTLTSTSSTQAATANAVKMAKDAANDANANANGRVSKSGDTMTGKLVIENANYLGHLQLVRGGISAEIAPSTAPGGELRFITSGIAKTVFDNEVAATGFTGATGSLNDLTVSNRLTLQNTSIPLSFNTTAQLGFIEHGDAFGLRIRTRVGTTGSGIAETFTISNSGGIDWTGVATGNGSGLTALNASNLASGTVPIARISSTSSRTSTSETAVLHAKAMNDHRLSGDHDSRYVNKTGDTLTGDVIIDKNNPWLTLNSSTSGANGVEQAAGISIGESGYKGNAALHLTYTGDGRGHIGMGTVDPLTSLPTHAAMRLYYTNPNVEFLGVVSGNGSGLTSLNASNLASGTIPNARISGTYTGLTNISGSGNVDFAKFLGNAADSAVAPSYSWTTDANTGMYRASDTEIGFSINGIKKGGVDATGFNGNGAGLTELNASNLASGTIPNARISGSYSGMANLTGSGNVDFAKFLGNAADTVSSPSFTWTSDTNTGIYRPASDTIGITIGGVERARFSSAGISGVGSGLTSLNASNLASGTVPIARISSTSLRTSASETTLLHAKAMNDHRLSGDHDDRYVMQTGSQSIAGIKNFTDSIRLTGPSAHLDINGNYKIYAAGYSASIATAEIVNLATIQMGSSSRHIHIVGYINGQVSALSGVVEFRLTVRTNTMPDKSFVLFERSTNMGRDLEILVYNNPNADEVHIAARAIDGGLHNINASFEVYSRDNYGSNLVTTYNAKTTLSPTGLTRVMPDTTISKDVGGELTVKSISGNGAGLIALDAGNLATGTVPTARLPAAALIGDTKYTAGNGITLSGTTFSVAGGDGLTQLATGLAVNATVVRTTGDQTIAGTKVFNGTLEVSGASSTPDFVVRRTNNTINANIKFETTSATDTYIGQGDSGHFSVGSTQDLRYINGGAFSVDVASGDMRWKGVATGDGSGLTALNAARITTGTLNADRLPSGTTVARGVVQLTTSTASTSTTLAATASAVKAANDNANSKVSLSGDTMTGSHLYAGDIGWIVSTTNTARQRVDARADDTNFARLHCYGISNTGATSNFRHAWYDGSSYIPVTAEAGTLKIGSRIEASSLQITPGLGIGLGAAAPSSSYNINMNDSFSANGTRAAIYSVANITDATLTANRVHYGIYNSLRNDYLSTESFTLTQRAAYNEVVNGPANDEAATINTAEGSRNYVLNRAAGTIVNAYGSYNYVLNNRAGATTTNAFGSYNYVHQTAGTVTNSYAGYFRVSGEVTGNKYGIYTTGEDKNYFAGDIGLGTTTPSARLHVNGDAMVGSVADSSSATKTLSVVSNGYAVVKINGDASNTSGEPGGSAVQFAVDGTLPNAVLGVVNLAGTRPDTSDAYTGTAANSLLLGQLGNSSLHLGTNGNVRLTINGAGNISYTGTLTGDGSGLTGTAALRATGTTKADVGLGSVNNAAQLELSGNQTAAGIKTFTGSIYIKGTSVAPDFHIERTNATTNANMRFTTTSATDVRIGQGDSAWFSVGASDDLTWAAGGVFRVGSTSGRIEWKGVAAGDGSGVTNINASNISDGTVAVARLPSTVVRMGSKDNTGNYLWVHRSSTAAAFYATNQSTGRIAEFRSGEGDGAVQCYINNNGSIVSTDNITAYSDARVKTNIKRIPNALSKVSQLGGYTFDRTDKANLRQTGVIAQEVREVLPEAVVEQEEGKLAVAYGNMVGLLIEAIKELKAEVETLREKVNAAA